MRNVLAAGLAASLAFGAACLPALAEDAPAKAYDAATVVATVNGKQITLGHVIAMRGRLPQQYQSLPDDVLLSGLIDQMIDQEVLAEAEGKADGDADPLQVKLALENERRGLLAGLAADAAVADAVSDAAVQAAYDKQVADFKPVPEYNASHILVDSEDKAKDLKAQIDGGADFAELAKANSSDGSAAGGGDLGWFSAGQMVPEFQAAVEALQVGAVSDPVKTQFGWHLVKLNETRDSAAPTLDEVRPQIEDGLRQAALQAKLTELRGAATIDKPATEIPPAAIRETDLLN